MQTTKTFHAMGWMWGTKSATVENYPRCAVWDCPCGFIISLTDTPRIILAIIQANYIHKYLNNLSAFKMTLNLFNSKRLVVKIVIMWHKSTIRMETGSFYVVNDFIDCINCIISKNSKRHMFEIENYSSHLTAAFSIIISKAITCSGHM